MPRRIVSVKSLTWSEARELIKKRIEEGMTTVYHDRVYQYLDMFAILPPDEARKMVEEIVREAGVSEDTAVVVANICPATPGEVRSILEMEREKKYSEETVQKILEIARRYCFPEAPAN